MGTHMTVATTAEQRYVVECRMHDTRHAFVSKLAERGTPASVIEDLTGHLTAEMRKRYTHISALAKEQAVGNLNSQPSQPIQ